MSVGLESWYSVRSSVVDYVKADLEGEAEKTIEGRPLNRIMVGILHPQQDLDADPQQTTVGETEEAEYGNERSPSKQDFELDADAALQNKSRPSSIGLTVAVDPRKTRIINVECEATRYINFSTTEKNERWSPETFSVKDEISLSPLKNQSSSQSVTLFDDQEIGLKVIALVRPVSDGRVRVTTSLINTLMRGQGRQDERCWFRPKLILTVDEGSFIDGRPAYEFQHRDQELAELDFLYRHEENLALGHGCSPTWSVEEGQTKKIESTFFPTQEVLLADPAPGSGKDPFGQYDLRMAQLMEGSSYGELQKLADAYLRWINQRSEDFEQETEVLERGQIKVGKGNLAAALDCQKRIQTGIDLLTHPDSSAIRQAFQLMNRAMLEQRFGANVDSTEATSFSWRPFQIAFILMNLPALSDPASPERDKADLLWFPTGGGKTEAYLGCIAFSTLYRRIVDSNAGGVSAIMRYTLRLLTSDQFDRAAKLICATEAVRRSHLPDSKVPVSLGMWVGNKTTPNRLIDAQADLDKCDPSSETANDEFATYQVRECPRCSAKIPFSAYSITDGSLIIPCPNNSCEFTNGLPLYFIDEELYSKRPSLIIGTVDKFAQMAWQPRVAELLGMSEEEYSPDLIIQDELHLLSGPLGTMVGLYECALDLALTSENGFRPKVIASTATIRQASDQVRAIFDRESVQFPPAGLTPDDNYFSRTADRMTQGTRQYIGVIAPGTSQTSLLVRLYAALLQGAQDLEKPNHLSESEWQQVVDSYWTLLGYFNSLRVLGSSSLLAVDDIPNRVELLAKRTGTNPRSGLKENVPSELTSRRSAGEIAATRHKMSHKYPDARTPNIVLATNMISVGLDIDRLGLMVVAGQPQNSSEYIQATSRVGRKHPGLVFVAFNANRTRDVSHFESFEYFHRTLYSSVEATTATPFSPRARDRGAHGVLVSAIRLLIPELREDESASDISAHRVQIDQQVVEPLRKRVMSVCGQDSDLAEAFMRRIEDLLEQWDLFAEDEERIRYRQPKAPHFSQTVPPDVLLLQSGIFDGPNRFTTNTPWETLTSLRDVDSETQLYLKKSRG